ncbi:MAG: family 43 glycosylhydrolase [Bacteroidota bacterium]
MKSFSNTKCPTWILIYFLSWVQYESISAQNPISPPGYYLADPSAQSWNDSILYLYTSTDISCDHWCSYQHDVLYTLDMKKWYVVSTNFFSKGYNDQVPYNDNYLFAPDCAKKGDEYIMFYCQPDKKNALGTAISNSPIGPFSDGQKLHTGDAHSKIDPSVFIDDDGTSYIVWGQRHVRMAVLESDMRTIDMSTLQDSIITKEEHFFHEGAYMTKRNGTYYLVYADGSRNKKPTCLGYATSNSPFGPYEYRGVIIDNAGCNPGNWNNHGSIFNYQDQWYVFYHRSTHGCRMFRKSCVEKIEFLADGSIPEVEMTTQGALPPLNASEMLEAERACFLSGNVRIEKESHRNEMLSQMKNGDQAVFKYLDFDKGVNAITLRYRTNEKGKLLLFTGSGADQQKVEEIELSSGATLADWEEQKFTLPTITGTHAITMEIIGDEEVSVDIDWLYFNQVTQ